MSKNITISEGENARVFGNTKKLKTLLQGEDAGSCFWVPEDETQANPTYIMENGLHIAADAGEYGFSVAHVNVPGKVTDLDGIDWDITIDEDGIPHIEIDDSDIEITIDDETSEIEVTIDKEPVVIDPEDFDLDPDEDIDISFDPEDMDVDIVGTDLDGDDVVIDFDPETGDFDTVGCPASIKVVFPPNNISYKDGDPIDITGLYIYAYDKDGNVYREGKYRDGRVPNGELSIVPPTADSSQGIGTFGTKNGDDTIYTAQAVSYSYSYEAKYSGSSEWIPESGGVDPIYCSINEYMIASQNIFDDIAIDIYAVNMGTKAYRKVAIASCPMSGPGMTVRNRSVSCSLPAVSGSLTDAIDAISENGRDYLGKRQSILVSWNDPCFKALETSFDVFVTEEDEGSHHSGKF